MNMAGCEESGVLALLFGPSSNHPSCCAQVPSWATQGGFVRELMDTLGPTLGLILVDGDAPELRSAAPDGVAVLQVSSLMNETTSEVRTESPLPGLPCELRLGGHNGDQTAALGLVTSGSTGACKVVVVPQCAVLDSLPEWRAREWVSADQRFGFNPWLFYYALYPIVSGACVVPIPDDVLLEVSHA